MFRADNTFRNKSCSEMRISVKNKLDSLFDHTAVLCHRRHKAAIDGRRKIACANFSSPLRNKSCSEKRNSMDIENKRAHEQKILTTMCRIYCKGNHGRLKDGRLCSECQELLDYALLRTKKCPLMETKTFCSACKIHCYAPKQQEKIRQVMKYAGPRMLPGHPVLTIKHGIVTLKGMRKSKINAEVKKN